MDQTDLPARNSSLAWAKGLCKASVIYLSFPENRKLTLTHLPFNLAGAEMRW